MNRKDKMEVESIDVNTGEIPPLLSAEDVGRLAGVSGRSVRRANGSPDMPTPIKIGNTYVYRKEELDRILAILRERKQKARFPHNQ